MSGCKRPLDKDDNNESDRKVKVPLLGNECKEIKLLKSHRYSIDPGAREWWKRTVIYEVYIRSFFDSNNYGVGDMAGIESKLDYFVNLGVEALWLTPFCTSPMKDFGYDVSDYLNIDPVFGSLDDFKNLKNAMNKRGLKLIMDFVPNHTSDQHEWFQNSCRREDPYTDYYIWKPSKGTNENGKQIPPNNWVSVFGGSMWDFNEERGEFYLHQFTKEQPDLNCRNNLVCEEMKKILHYWLDLGVDGFRMDAVSHLFEDEDFRDEQKSGDHSSQVSPEEYSYWDHYYTSNRPEVLDLLHTFRVVLDSHTVKDGHPRFMATEAYLRVNELVKYYGTPEKPIAHFPFNFALIDRLKMGFTGRDLYNIVSDWMENVPQGTWPNWVMGNHDVSRVSTRFGKEMLDLLHMVIHLLPGTSVCYAGDEIGMENTELSWDETVDPSGRNAGQDKYKVYSRDPERTPMQWNRGKNAGFSKADKTWLPVNPNYMGVNVEVELEAEESHLKIFKRLVEARKMEAFYGDLEIQLLDENVFAFTRIANGSNPALLVIINCGDNIERVNASCFVGIPDTLKIYTRSLSPELSSELLRNNEKEVRTDSIIVENKSGIVFTFSPTNKLH